MSQGSLHNLAFLKAIFSKLIFFSFSQLRVMSKNTWKDFLHVLKVFKLTIKSAVVMRSTLVSRALSISLKQRPISFFEILLIAQISVEYKFSICR